MQMVQNFDRSKVKIFGCRIWENSNTNAYRYPTSNSG